MSVEKGSMEVADNTFHADLTAITRCAPATLLSPTRRTLNDPRELATLFKLPVNQL